MGASDAIVVKQHLIDPEDCIRCNTCEDMCPIKAISHDESNYVVDVDICKQCLACISPCPTGAIDNWRFMPKARAYSVQEQFGWTHCRRSSVRRHWPKPALASTWRRRSPRWHPLCRATRPARPRVQQCAIWRPAATLVGRARICQPVRTEGAGQDLDRHGERHVWVTQVGKEYDTHHVVLDFGTTPFPVLEGQSISNT